MATKPRREIILAFARLAKSQADLILHANPMGDAFQAEARLLFDLKGENYTLNIRLRGVSSDGRSIARSRAVAPTDTIDGMAETIERFIEDFASECQPA